MKYYNVITPLIHRLLVIARPHNNRPHRRRPQQQQQQQQQQRHHTRTLLYLVLGAKSQRVTDRGRSQEPSDQATRVLRANSYW